MKRLLGVMFLSLMFLSSTGRSDSAEDAVKFPESVVTLARILADAELVQNIGIEELNKMLKGKYLALINITSVNVWEAVTPESSTQEPLLRRGVIAFHYCGPAWENRETSGCHEVEVQVVDGWGWGPQEGTYPPSLTVEYVRHSLNK